MSWLQGVIERDDLPESFLKWADAHGKGALQYVTWFDDERRVLFLDYGEEGALRAVFRESPFA